MRKPIQILTSILAILSAVSFFGSTKKGPQFAKGVEALRELQNGAVDERGMDSEIIKNIPTNICGPREPDNIWYHL